VEEKINSYECYTTYLSLTQHFTNKDYDYHKYHGKVKANVTSFENRKDKYFFEKLAKHPDPQGFLLANILAGGPTYIRDLAYGEQAKKVYTDWLKTKESLTYVFTNEITILDSDFNRNFICHSGRHPNLLRLYLARKISIETLCILCNLTGCLKYWDKKMLGDPVYEDIGRLIKKYMPFIHYDKDKMRKVILKWKNQ
jgi:hypothetical protein